MPRRKGSRSQVVNLSVFPGAPKRGDERGKPHFLGGSIEVFFPLDITCNVKKKLYLKKGNPHYFLGGSIEVSIKKDRHQGGGTRGATHSVFWEERVPF